MQVVHEEVRSLPQVTIAKLTGLARGGGNEFLMALDMRFAAIGKAGQAQPEVLLGIMPGGGGTQYMTSLAGRARTLELILGAQLVDAELAERYGLVNRALPADEIDEFVDSLAARIGALDPGIIAAVKTAVTAAATPITREGLDTENALLTPSSMPTPPRSRTSCSPRACRPEKANSTSKHFSANSDLTDEVMDPPSGGAPTSMLPTLAPQPTGMSNWLTDSER